ncbi:MAG: 50S ribosomal protein L11 methyltransferase [Candidatus Magasanikbacteria bacterium]|nr:50S ribosomal protein L11 methyltransferase [Candidatus Magasanikbacteria bacterium]
MTSRIQYNNPQQAEALGLPYHYEMVSDAKRVTPFKKAIQKVCKGKRVLESGAGSGILSILAAKAGAKKVYAVEIDPKVARFAEANIRKSGFQDRIKLIRKDIFKTTLEDLDDEKVDVVIAENLSTWQVTEPQIPILNYINKNLIKQDGARIPALIFNYVELAQSQYQFENAVEIRTHYFGFTGVKKPRILSKRQLFTTIDLRQQNSLRINRSIKIKIAREGTLNSLRLTSPLQVYDGINFESSDSLMPPVIIPLNKDVHVIKGDMIQLDIRYSYHTNWDAIRCRAKLIN